MRVGGASDGEDRTVEARRVGPTEDRRYGSVSSGADVRVQQWVRCMGETGVGTKREDCETLLDGVGLPAKSSYYSYSLFFIFFIFFFSFSICLFNPKKWRRKNWGNGKCTKQKWEWELRIVLWEE